ncbi:MAG: hypothetical protein Q9222_002802 [Ikaeria aurantiellina]
MSPGIISPSAEPVRLVSFALLRLQLMDYRTMRGAEGLQYFPDAHVETEADYLDPYATSQDIADRARELDKRIWVLSLLACAKSLVISAPFKTDFSLIAPKKILAINVAIRRGNPLASL